MHDDIEQLADTRRKAIDKGLAFPRIEWLQAAASSGTSFRVQAPLEQTLSMSPRATPFYMP